MSKLGTFLEGVRILDLSQYIPGPMATLFLRDMGASVIKIEPPAGDGMQQLGPRDAADRPIFYHALNAGKSLLRLDLKSDAGRATFLDLVAHSDVVVEGFRPGVLDRLDIAYPVLRGVNPRIILCSISGYGPATARAGEAGHDANFLALGGVMHRNGSDRPLFFDPPISDVSGALFAGMAILGALARCQRVGEGCAIDIALADTLMPLQLMQVAGVGESGLSPGRGGTYLNGGAAYYNVYETADACHIVLGAVERKFWVNFCVRAGRPDWIERQGEPIPQIALQSEVAAYVKSLTVVAMIDRFRDCDCCLTPVLDLRSAVENARVVDRALVRRGAAGDLQALFPARIDGEPPAARPAGPIPSAGT